MKRQLATLLLITASIIAVAKPPKLACETVFDREDLRIEGIRIVKSQSGNSNYRSIKFSDGKKYYDDLYKLIIQDKQRAQTVYESFEGKNESILLQIPNNGHQITVSLRRNDDGSVELYISGLTEAFK
ncbi:MAG: hypothetical protein K2M04_02560 [Muribaculaceae bacterium]|nr:hypothetical protein [Muribaculaceae bacterium]